jgi:hypothetical protein
MRRGLLLLLGLLVVTWFEFQVYPGHSYLQGETQLLVPMLERLDTTGFLSRDLVASNPAFAYTIYDEISQFLHAAAGLPFENALLAQQVVFRFAAIAGIFLLARAMHVAPLPSLLLSGSINAITHLAAPETFVTSPEATPVSFALSLVFLAAGLLALRKSLLASLAAGFALLYDPVTAAACWLMLIAAWLFDPSLRRLLRPAWAVLIVFSLLWANLVQLQAGLGAGEELTARMSAATVQLTRIRTPWVWVSDWGARGLLSYAFLTVAGLWALALIWKHTDHITRWVALGLLASGFVSVLAALAMLGEPLQFSAAMSPARNLSLTVTVSVLLCGAAAWHYPKTKIPWITLLIAAILNSQVLDLLHGRLDVVRHHSESASVRQLADWAGQNTWGSSLFQFPDAGKENYPSVFRALSKRGLWADWQSGVIIDYSAQAGQEWWVRWQATMSKPYSPKELQEMLPLPIDYYVLKQSNSLANAKPVYSNSDYIVYDAQDLRESHQPLNAAPQRPH